MLRLRTAQSEQKFCALLGSLEKLLLPRMADSGLENHLSIQVILKKEEKKKGTKATKQTQ